MAGETLRVRQHHQLAGPGQRLDADLAEQAALGLLDVDVARADDQVDLGDRLGTQRQRGDRLRSADGVHLLDARAAHTPPAPCGRAGRRGPAESRRRYRPRPPPGRGRPPSPRSKGRPRARPGRRRRPGRPAAGGCPRSGRAAAPGGWAAAAPRWRCGAGWRRAARSPRGRPRDGGQGLVQPGGRHAGGGHVDAVQPPRQPAHRLVASLAHHLDDVGGGAAHLLALLTAGPQGGDGVETESPVIDNRCTGGVYRPAVGLPGRATAGILEELPGPEEEGDTDRDTAHVIAALAALLLCAHAGGYLFARYRQPPVIGEILGGLRAGADRARRHLARAPQDWLFPTTGAAARARRADQLGLLLLMFMAGRGDARARSHRERGPHGRRRLGRRDARCRSPLGLAFVRALAPQPLRGHGDEPHRAVLVFAIAIAVTSIPVISRIMLDLGLLGTRFARIVLTRRGHRGRRRSTSSWRSRWASSPRRRRGAVRPGRQCSGSASRLGGERRLPLVATLGFLGASRCSRPAPCTARLLRLAVQPGRRAQRRWRSSWSCMLPLTAPACCSASPRCSAPSWPASSSARRRGERAATSARRSARSRFAFFIPIYFAMVGLKLDLVDAFELGLLPRLPRVRLRRQGGQVYARRPAGRRDAASSTPTWRSR